MKLIIHKNQNVSEATITIECNKVDQKLTRIISNINMFIDDFTVTRDNVEIPISLEQVYYFDTVDDKTFLYMEKEVYQCDKRLYELEEQLENTPFVRISKSCIVNTFHVVSVKPHFSGRIIAELTNKEQQIVSKHYVKTFRNKITMGG